MTSISVIVFIKPTNSLVELIIKRIRKLDSFVKILAISPSDDPLKSVSIYDHEILADTRETALKRLGTYLKQCHGKHSITAIKPASASPWAHTLAGQLNASMSLDNSTVWNIEQQAKFFQKQNQNLEEAEDCYRCSLFKSGEVSSLIACYQTNSSVMRAVTTLDAWDLKLGCEAVLNQLGYDNNIFILTFTISNPIKLVSCKPAFCDTFSASMLYAFSLSTGHKENGIQKIAQMLLQRPITSSVYPDSGLPYPASRGFLEINLFKASRDGKLNVDAKDGIMKILPTFFKTFQFSQFAVARQASVKKNDTLAFFVFFGEGVHIRSDVKKFRDYIDNVQYLILHTLPSILVLAPYSTSKSLIQCMRKYTENNGINLSILGGNDTNVPLALTKSIDSSIFAKLYNYAVIEDLETDTRVMMSKIRNDGYDITHIIAGSEPGVIAADFLQEKYGLQGNGTRMSKHRASKFLMHDTLARNKLRSCRQRNCSSLSEAQDFAKSVLGFPCVAKPDNAAAAIGVIKCFSKEDIHHAWERNVNTKERNILGNIPLTLLMQEFLDGVEYVVNTVSFEGKHALSMLFEYEKHVSHGGFAYGCITAIPYSHDVESTAYKLFNYAEKVLDALDFRYGPCHMEVMMTKGSPCLVEVNGRIHGSSGPLLESLSSHESTNQVALATDALLNSGKEVLRSHESVKNGGMPYTLLTNLTEFKLISTVDGILDVDLDKSFATVLAKLSSVNSTKFNVSNGDVIERTRDLMTSPGSLILVNNNKDILDLEIALLRDFERSGKAYIARDPVSGKLLNSAVPSI